MNSTMNENLRDLQDIRRQMDIYQPIGREYLRQVRFYRNYEKAVERWQPSHKIKNTALCALIMLLVGPLGLIAAAALWFGGHDKILEIKERQKGEQEKKIMDLHGQFLEKYLPVQEKCERLLLGQEDYEVPMAVDYLIYVISNERAETMKEAYNMLDEQLHRGTMENMQREQLDLQREQCKQLRRIEVNTTISAASDLFHVINSL